VRHVLPLFDAAATRQNILRVLGDELFTRTMDNDRALIFYAGHGQTQDLPGGGKEGYIIPVDGLEEKDLRQRQLLDTLVATYWGETGTRYTAPLPGGLATRLGVALLAYGGVSHSKVSGNSITLGPFSRHVHTLQIRVNVCLFAAASQTALCQAGAGEAQQEAAGVLYEFRGERLDIEHNAAGRATRQAITQAVHALVRHIQFLPE
jgi:hypothetical protein